jgi:hypothetical protein
MKPSFNVRVCLILFLCPAFTPLIAELDQKKPNPTRNYLAPIESHPSRPGGMWIGGQTDVTTGEGDSLTIRMDASEPAMAAAGRVFNRTNAPDFPYGSVMHVSAALETNLTELPRRDARGAVLEIDIRGPLGQRRFFFLSPEGRSVGERHMDLKPFQGEFKDVLDGRFYIPENAQEVRVTLYNSFGVGAVTWSEVSLSKSAESVSPEWSATDDFSEEPPPPPDFLIPYQELMDKPAVEQERPRRTLLLFDQTPEEIRAKAERAEWKPLVDQLLQDARKTLTEPMIDRLAEMDVAETRRAVRQIIECIISYWITGDEAFVQNAKERLINLSERPVFLPPRHAFISYDLVMAETLFGLSVGYDWLYEDLTPDQRETIRQASIERLLPYYLHESDRSPTRPNINGTGNWSGVLGSIAILASIAFEGEHPIFEEARKRADVNSRPWRAMQSDGGQYEGAGYWNYLFSYSWPAYLERKRRTGDDDGFFSEPGRKETEAGWFPFVKRPYGTTLGFGDDWANPRWTITPLLIERTEGHRKYSAWLRKWLFEDPVALRAAGLYSQGTTDVFGLGFALIYALPEGIPVIDDSALPSNLMIFPNTGFAIAASNWPNPATYVSSNAGTQNLHSHADLGSFYYAVDGEVLLDDPGPNSYTAQGYFDWRRRFSIYKARAEDHNVFTINGMGNALDDPYKPDHQMMRADIIDAKREGGVSQWTVVLDNVYEGIENLAARRHFVFVESTGELAVIDDIQTEAASTITHHLLTRGTLTEFGPGRYRVARGAASALLLVHANHPLTFEFGPHGPSPEEQDGSLVRLQSTAPDTNQLTFVTLLLPGLPNQAVTVEFDQIAGASWTFPISGLAWQHIQK